MEFLFSCLATIAVTPVPANGSKLKSPTLEDAKIILVNSLTGDCC